MLYKEITKCRVCGSANLISIVNLGDQALTGVFPVVGEDVERGPLEIVKCGAPSLNNSECCGLVQLRHDYQMEKLYGDNYGYRSGLNKSMVNHLRSIVEKIERRIDLSDGDLVIDIASNDGTLLSAYTNKKLDFLGIDPTSDKFSSFYPSYIKHIPEFFSAHAVRNIHGDRSAKVITSIAMFYDLPDPIKIMCDIGDILDTNGIWVVEQSYMPTMIDNVSYDTICHEHLEYYALRQFKWMADRSGLKIIDIEFNDTNGASFCLTLAKKESKYQEASSEIERVLRKEDERGFNSMQVYEEFREKTEKHRDGLLKIIREINGEGGVIFGYGASTKGNVILQYCGLTSADIPYISEVNEYKFGRLTPGTKIPIISEEDASKKNPNYYLVLPWHFRKGIIEREKNFLASGGGMIFPLPKIEII